MPHPSPTTPTPDEQRLILRSTTGNARDHLIVSMALGTGLRLSSRRQTILSIANSAAGGAKNIDDQINGGLFPNPYDNLQTIVHEAFHVYRGRRAPGRHTMACRGARQADVNSRPSSLPTRMARSLW